MINVCLRVLDYNKLNHVEMRSDIEYSLVEMGENLFFAGVRGEIGSTGIFEIDSNFGIYSYESKPEFESDCKLLGIN